MVATTLERAEAAERGAMKRDAGIALATLNRRELIDRCELRFLEAILRNGIATTDDCVDDLFEQFTDGGRWRGSIPLRLAREGLIERVSVSHSNRSSRHRGWLAVWGIKNRTAIEERCRQLRLMLDALTNGTGSTGATAEPALNSTINPQAIGGKDHGTIK